MVRIRREVAAEGVAEVRPHVPLARVGALANVPGPDAESLQQRGQLARGQGLALGVVGPRPILEGGQMARQHLPLELIEAALTHGRDAMTIWRDLVDDHGFPAQYASVRRFVIALRGQQRLLPMAGFEVSTYGRIWVSTEATDGPSLGA